ncbi:hypothetical protein GIB67_005759 [Kingdonia uniflora]|uniref:RING-type E3 ubiquitin transferase n=1 Tax=Kingdonia uniflora TaxID=39325 RepID=A0A7J7KVK8_9MAGN|nr:hypothetical protein GIB67_005759 [Kingdonia uniflora]
MSHQPFHSQLEISPSPPSNPTLKKPPTSFDVSMGLTILVLFTALLFMCCMSFYMRRCDAEVRRSQNSNSRRYQRPMSTVVVGAKSVPRGLDPDVVNKLPLFCYEGNEEDEGDCAVCLGEFEEGKSVRVIPCCGHLFHQDCIDMWFASHDSCPLCRATQLFHLSRDASQPCKEEGSIVVDVRD